MNVNEMAVVATLSVSMWGGTITDRQEGANVARNKNAKEHRVRVVKRLVDSTDMKALRDASRSLRHYHRLLTLPWNDTGDRLLPIRHIQKYRQTIDKYTAEFSHAIQEFLGKYDVILANCQQELGQLFSHYDFPTRMSMGQLFAVDSLLTPVPESNHFGDTLTGDAVLMATMKQRVDEETTARMKTAMKEPYERVGAAVKHLVAKLKAPDSDDKTPIFRDSSIKAIKELVDVLPGLNISGDPDLAAITDSLQSSFLDVTPDMLRPKSENFSQEKTDAITESIERLQRDYGGYFEAPKEERA